MIMEILVAELVDAKVIEMIASQQRTLKGFTVELAYSGVRIPAIIQNNIWRIQQNKMLVVHYADTNKPNKILK